MMKVYICQNCGWIRVVSKLPYEKVGHMSEEERKDYAKTWLYLHGTKHE